MITLKQLMTDSKYKTWTVGKLKQLINDGNQFSVNDYKKLIGKKSINKAEMLYDYFQNKNPQ